MSWTGLVAGQRQASPLPLMTPAAARLQDRFRVGAVAVGRCSIGIAEGDPSAGGDGLAVPLPNLTSANAVIRAEFVIVGEEPITSSAIGSEAGPKKTGDPRSFPHYFTLLSPGAPH